MKEQKTKPTTVSVTGYLDKIADDEQRADAKAILKVMKQVTGLKPRMWGPSMIGFGEYHYKYDSGHEGDCFMTGFAPRKGQMTVYFVGFDRFASQLKKLGKHKTGKSCLYFRRLADVDQAVLREMMEINFARVKAMKNKKKT